MHKIRVFIRKLKRNKSYQYKARYIMILFIIFTVLFLSIIGLTKTFGLFESSTKISPNIETAIYVLEPGEYIYNMNIEDLIPSDSPYIYNFTVSNYNDDEISDVDMNYELEIITTTNIPLEYDVYRNEDYRAGESIISSREKVKDEDSTWYNYFKTNTTYNLPHNEKTIDTYTITVIFPSTYKTTTIYTEQIENIEIKVNSKQVIEVYDEE